MAWILRVLIVITFNFSEYVCCQQVIKSLFFNAYRGISLDAAVGRGTIVNQLERES